MLQPPFDKVLLVYHDSEEVVEGIIVSGERTVVTQLSGKRLPLAIILNYNDTGYYKQIFTHETLEWFTSDSFVIFVYLES